MSNSRRAGLCADDLTNHNSRSREKRVRCAVAANLSAEINGKNMQSLIQRL